MLPRRRSHLRVAIVLITLALCAFLLAQGATTLVAAALVRPVAPLPAPVLPSTGPPGPDAREILARNVFDSETGPLWPPPVLPAPTPPKTLLPGPWPPPCEDAGRLVASVHDTRHPELSIVSVGESGGAQVYGVEQAVGPRVVVAIGPELVLLRARAGSLCALRLFGERTPPARAAPPSRELPDAASSHASPTTAPRPLDGVRALSPTRFAIERSVVDRVLRDPVALGRLAIVVPHVRGGHASGLRLYRIAPDSLLHRLGLRSGDLLRRIGDHALGDADQALSAYAALRDAVDLELEVERRGELLTLGYAIE